MTDLVWTPQPGPQYLMLTAPITEIVFGGARGGGKTDGLIGDYLQHAARWGQGSQGIIFRKSYPETEAIEERMHEIYPRFGAIWKASKRTFRFPNGASIKIRYIEKKEDARKYQGHEYTWIGVDELTNYASMEPIDMMRGCLRSGHHQVQKRFVATCNPGGPGHNVVKARYIDPASPYIPFDIIDSGGEVLGQSLYIPSRLKDNPLLLKNNPDYVNQLKQAGSPDLVRAWLDGDWDIVAGGMFDDLWRRNIHVIKPFKIPVSWHIDRAFDWGFSRPFSVGWWAESDGSMAPNGVRYPKGTKFRIAEWYGVKKGRDGRSIPNEGIKITPEEIAQGIVERQARMKYSVKPGPADPSIWDKSTGTSIADMMERKGVRWTKGIATAGSRVTRWQILRKLLKNSLQLNQGPMEDPGIFVFDHCTEFIRTMPTLTRDEINLDDIDTEQEDHIADETGYEILTKRQYLKSRGIL